MIVEDGFIFVKLKRHQAEHMGAVWNNKKKRYRLPLTLGALNELKMIGYNVGHLIKQRTESRNKLLGLKQLEDIEGDKRLRPYQRVDVHYLKHLDNAGIFNEQRTGKTPTTLVLAEEKGYSRIIIVCPASLIYNWLDEVKKWTKYDMRVIDGTKKKRLKQYEEGLKHNGFIISYETLRNDVEAVENLVRKYEVDCMIVDEAHRLRSLIRGKRAAQIAKTTLKIGLLCKHRYALTGTPTVRDGQEIWAILHFLYPKRFPGYWQFIERYFYLESNPFSSYVVGGYKREKELQEILAVLSTNRKRDEVMKWLPDKQYQTIRLKLNKDQQKVYDEVFNTFVYEDIIDAQNPLTQLLRLRQITTCPSVLDLDVPNEKEKFILEWLEDNSNERVIIFSTFSSYLKELQRKIKGSSLIIGETAKTERDRIVKDFQAGKTKVLLANIKAAGTGLTLDAGETIIFLDKEYNPSDNEQAEDRIVPTAKERNHKMHIISLVMQDTVDEYIEFMLREKMDITKVVNNGGIEALERIYNEQ